jgi:hypothetical protein
MSTPSETMFTATIHGSRAVVNPASFSAALGSLCRTSNGLCPVASHRSAAILRAWDESAAITNPPASRCPSLRSIRSLASASRRIRASPSGSSVEIAVR